MPNPNTSISSRIQIESHAFKSILLVVKLNRHELNRLEMLISLVIPSALLILNFEIIYLLLLWTSHQCGSIKCSINNIDFYNSMFSLNCLCMLCAYVCVLFVYFEQLLVLLAVLSCSHCQ